ncbi:hypothetical protein PSHT_02578 [Puccinia striiformis]|uniref:Uncharacterized protein n=1 Tax=Puccinia striiformis TaxID=27350 RepID=A0A2S4WHQ4_9BASI|nr:hypothetical protein PSHT_02578 [Puccinia striiformis]
MSDRGIRSRDDTELYNAIFEILRQAQGKLRQQEKLRRKEEKKSCSEKKRKIDAEQKSCGRKKRKSTKAQS